MKTKLTSFSLATALCAFALAAPMNADVVTFSNLNAPTIDADPISTFGPIADSFSTAEYGTTLNQVSLKLSGTPGSGSVTVRLLSNAANTPGAVLGTIGTLSDSALSSTLANFTLTLTNPFSLTANTRYWIQLSSNNSSAAWAWSNVITGPGVARESFANVNGVFQNAADAPYQMQVTTATPEPSTYAFMGLGLVGLAIWRKRRTLAN
jgi:hypothetical protein